MIVQIVLFNVLVQMFSLDSCSCAFDYLLCFVDGQRTKEIENKTYNKETDRVSQPVRSLNYVPIEQCSILVSRLRD